jgi:hypothetical protein
MVLQDYLEVRVPLALVVYETSTLKSVVPEVCAMNGIETEEGIAVATDGKGWPVGPLPSVTPRHERMTEKPVDMVLL